MEPQDPPQDTRPTPAPRTWRSASRDGLAPTARQLSGILRPHSWAVPGKALGLNRPLCDVGVAPYTAPTFVVKVN